LIHSGVIFARSVVTRIFHKDCIFLTSLPVDHPAIAGNLSDK
jgi:hypothetical protein